MKDPVGLLVESSALAGVATLLNAAELHEIAAICGALATIATAVAAIVIHKRGKKP